MSEPEYGDWANAYGWLAWLTWSDWGDWHVAWRCRDCGAGYEIAPADAPATPRVGNNRWLCPVCGASIDQLIKWVGRKRNRVIHRDDAGRIWHWLPAEKLPTDLQPKSVRSKIEAEIEAEVARRLPKLLDEEFERRVRAAVEVERVARAAGGADP